MWSAIDIRIILWHHNVEISSNPFHGGCLFVLFSAFILNFCSCWDLLSSLLCLLLCSFLFSKHIPLDRFRDFWAFLSLDSSTLQVSFTLILACCTWVKHIQKLQLRILPFERWIGIYWWEVWEAETDRTCPGPERAIFFDRSIDIPSVDLFCTLLRPMC